MRKFLLSLTLMIMSFASFSQTCYTPPTGGVFVTLDSNYLLGTVAAGNTKVGMCFYNSTTSKITATQFRVYYDTVAFSGVDSVTSLDTTFPQYLKFVDNHGYVTITLTYTGNISTFYLHNGAYVKLQLHHTPGFAALSSVANMSFAGTPSYSAVATTQSGMDTTLTLFNFGGVFRPQTMSYHGTFVNVTGSKAKNLTVAIDKKLRPGGSWVHDSTAVTDTNGRFAFVNIPLDTTGYDVRLNIKGDTMGVGSVISVADAQRINQYVLGTATPTGFDYYESDVNGDNTLSISDVYGVFGKVSGRFTVWPNSVKDIKFFTASEFSTINGSSTNYTATIPGVTNFTYNIVAGAPDSVTYYVMVPGDANNTGYHMARLVPIEIVNPSHASLHIIDVTTQYDDVYKKIEVNYPDLTVNEENLVNVPVIVKTNDNKLGSLQLGMKYDNTLLDFKGLKAEATVGSWITFLNPNNGQIDWGGYDPTPNTNLLSNNDLAFTLQFTSKKIQSDWNESPLYVTSKFAGDTGAADLAITPTNAIIKVFKLSGSATALKDGEDLKVFPNPTEDYVNIAFRINEDGQVWVGIYDLNGKECKVILNESMPKGVYNYGASLGYLPAGQYLAVIKKVDKQLSNKLMIK